jgi:hypothetical protein
MSTSTIVWDIETVPDLKGFAAANGHDGKSDDEIRDAMGDKFPKHIYHSIICIGALVALADFPLHFRLRRPVIFGGVTRLEKGHV